MTVGRTREVCVMVGGTREVGVTVGWRWDGDGRDTGGGCDGGMEMEGTREVGVMVGWRWEVGVMVGGRETGVCELAGGPTEDPIGAE